MCTVVVASQVVAGSPLVVVANRDEELERPARPPFVWPEGFLAPRDELAGGTWLGLNAHGVFVGITNRMLGGRDASRRTRGEIVVAALRERSARDVHARMRSLDPRAYNGFHLVYADAHAALATFADGETLAQVTLGRGVHVITERSFGGGDDSRRLARIRAAWQAWDLGRPDTLPSLLAEHDPNDPLASTCMHLPELRYGTRSAMVLMIGQRPEDSRMLWAEGPPCTTPFVAVPVPVSPGKVVETSCA
jgi:uncharacterized protein with NRDE domain